MSRSLLCVAFDSLPALNRPVTASLRWILGTCFSALRLIACHALVGATQGKARQQAAVAHG